MVEDMVKEKIRSNPIRLYREAAAEVECWLAEEKHHPDGCGGGVEREATTGDERRHAGGEATAREERVHGGEKEAPEGERRGLDLITTMYEKLILGYNTMLFYGCNLSIFQTISNLYY
jgi:hypothetical protein